MISKASHLGWPALIGLIALTGACRVTEPDHHFPPPAPAGVYTVTGDGYVEIFWTPLYDRDLAGYRIYRNREPYGDYTRVGSSSDAHHVDDDVSNGVTYYYAVTAYDRHGEESDLSYEIVHDTPRPAGHDLTVYDEDDFAGVDFSGYYDDMIQPWDDPFVDMYLLWLGGHYAMASTDVQIGDAVYGTDIQPAGYVESLDDIDWAPAGGWSVEVADTVLLHEGHGYLVWTWENHYAKFRVRHIGYDYVVLDWAYQIDEGNPELLIVPGDRNEHTPGLKQARQAAPGYRLPEARSGRYAQPQAASRAAERGRQS